jgi:hypothetical protein
MRSQFSWQRHMRKDAWRAYCQARAWPDCRRGGPLMGDGEQRSRHVEPGAPAGREAPRLEPRTYDRRPRGVYRQREQARLVSRQPGPDSVRQGRRLPVRAAAARWPEITGSSTFTVRPGTGFVVPMANADDSPPFPQPYPASREDAIPYFFGKAQYGGRGWEISVDGNRTPIGSGYLAGPVTTPPLPDGGGPHMITLGAFLHPLGPGTHTVTVNGGFFRRRVS